MHSPRSKEMMRTFDSEALRTALGEDTMKRVTFYGHEKNETTAKLAQVNLAVHGLEGTIRAGNEAITYYKDPHELVGQCDFVMANHRFNVDEVDAEKVRGDRRLPFGLPGVNKAKKVSNANYLWLQYFLPAASRRVQERPPQAGRSGPSLCYRGARSRPPDRDLGGAHRRTGHGVGRDRCPRARNRRAVRRLGKGRQWRNPGECRAACCAQGLGRHDRTESRLGRTDRL